MDAPKNRLDLLLAAADEGKPVLEDGLSNDTVKGAKKPKGKRDGMPDWKRNDADPNQIHLQKWGVIAANGREGDKQLEAISPLIRLREAEQGVPATIYRVEPEMDAKQSLTWKQDVYGSEDVHDEDRPLYLLMLGDLHHTSLELQHSLANDALVGRVHFADTKGETDLAGYTTYANKVANYARAPAGEVAASADLLFYTAPDGSEATEIGRTRLVDPSLAVSEQERALGRLPAASVRQLAAETVSELCDAAKDARSSVLLTVSHGLGAPRRGPWKTNEEQWQRQGAMMLRYDQIMDAERLRKQPFLPGGMWFYLACFGAGTPSSSAYAPWLSQLASEDAYGGSIAAVLKSLPAEGERGFVAALPQAALLNEKGPLAVIGHMDLAWTYGFSGVKRLAESRKTRVLTVLEAMVRGSRAGVALDGLTAYYKQANDALAISYDLETRARETKKPDPTDRVERGHLWMLRNDLRGYVLLGDPAARLPLQQFAPPVPVSAPASVSAPVSAPAPVSASEPASAFVSVSVSVPDSALVSASAKEAAVQALLQGDETPRAIAKRAGVDLPILWDWVDASRAAQRERRNG